MTFVIGDTECSRSALINSRVDSSFVYFFVDFVREFCVREDCELRETESRVCYEYLNECLRDVSHIAFFFRSKLSQTCSHDGQISIRITFAASLTD